MREFENNEFYERIDQLIKMKMTGSPKEFAFKLGMSESNLYRVLKCLKEKAHCPILFNKGINSYIYEYAGKLEIKFCYQALEEEELSKINGGIFFSHFYLSLSQNESAVYYF